MISEGTRYKIIEVLRKTDEIDNEKWRKEIASYARNHYAQDKIIEELDELYKKAIDSKKE